jgi:hypothetical protein
MAEAAPYPVTFAAAYPERLSRLSTFFRLLLFIPVAIFGAVLLGSQLYQEEAARGGATVALGTAGAVAVAAWLAILVRGRIPRWLFDFQVALYRWSNRAFGYLFLLTDHYPPFEGDWVISYDVRYPERLSRWKLLFWKVITAIPHFIILLFLTLGAIIVTVIAWFFILIAGRYPRGLYDYVVGVMRWGARVQAYVLSLTDEYPPFNLSSDAGPAGGDAYLISSILGFLLAGGAIAGGVVAVLVVGEETQVQLSYQSLQSGTPAPTTEMRDVMVTLLSATDPLLDGETLLEPDPGNRLVMFSFRMANDSWRDVKIRESDFKLRDEDGKERKPELVTVAGHAAPQEVQRHEAVTMKAVFELPEGVAPAELKFAPSFAFHRAVKYVLR